MAEFSDAQKAYLDSMMTKWMGPDSEVMSKLKAQNAQIEVMEQKLADLETRFAKLEKDHSELKKNVVQSRRSDKEVVLTGYKKNHKDFRKVITGIMRKIDKELKDREVISVKQFGAGDFKRLSVMMMSNHARNRFIDACILNPAIEFAKNFSRGKTQEGRRRNKEKYLIYEKARQANRDEVDRDTFFHHPFRNKDGDFIVKRSRCDDTKLTNVYEAYRADRIKHDY